jgi:putative transposase
MIGQINPVKLAARQTTVDQPPVEENTGTRFRPKHRDHIWTYKIATTTMYNGGVLQILTIKDEGTQEYPAIRVDRKITSRDVMNQLFSLFIYRAIPSYVRSDKGFGLTDYEVCFWLERLGFKTRFIEAEIMKPDKTIGQHFPGLADEPPVKEIFQSLAEARELIERWRQRHNKICLRSKYPGTRYSSN